MKGRQTHFACQSVTRGSAGFGSWSLAVTRGGHESANLTGSSRGDSLSYNAKNQTTEVTYNGQTLSPLVYADLDQSERTRAGAGEFYSSPLGVQISRRAGESTYYTRDNRGELVGERLADGSRWYYLKDGLGSVTAVINEDGSQVADRYAYDPYGQSEACAQ